MAYSLVQPWIQKGIDREDAVTLAHVALLKAIRGRFDPEKGTFGTYLGRVLANEARTWLKQQAKREQFEVESLDAPAVRLPSGDRAQIQVRDEQDVLDVVARKDEFRRKILPVLSKFSERERKAIVLQVGYRVPIKQVAQMVGLEVPEVRRTVRRFRRAFSREGRSCR